jgi:hypothetical protein
MMFLFVLGRFLTQISARKPAVLAVVFRGFLQSLQASLKIGHDHLFIYSFYFTVHWVSYHPKLELHCELLRASLHEQLYSILEQKCPYSSTVGLVGTQWSLLRKRSRQLWIGTSMRKIHDIRSWMKPIVTVKITVIFENISASYIRDVCFKL